MAAASKDYSAAVIAGAIGPGAGPPPAGHVHGHDPPQSPDSGGGRQQRGRSDRRIRPRDRGHAVEGRLDRGHRRRPRDAGRHPSPAQDFRRGADSHAAARGRQVRQRELQLLRRPARRGRLGGQRPLREWLEVEVKRDGKLYRQSLCRKGKPKGQAQGRRHSGQTQHGHHGFASCRRPSYFDSVNVAPFCGSSTCCAPRPCCVPGSAGQSQRRGQEGTRTRPGYYEDGLKGYLDRCARGADDAFRRRAVSCTAPRATQEAVDYALKLGDRRRRARARSPTSI